MAKALWRRGVVVITTAQLHSTKPELRFCAGSNPARGVLEIRDGEDLWQWSRLEIRLNAFRRSTRSQKQFIIINSSSSSVLAYLTLNDHKENLSYKPTYWLINPQTEQNWKNQQKYNLLLLEISTMEEH